MLKEEFEELLAAQYKRKNKAMPTLHVTAMHDHHGKQYGIFSDSSGKIEIYSVMPNFRIRQLTDPAIVNAIIEEMKHP